MLVNFERSNDFLIIVTDELLALEAISEILYEEFKITYLIQVDTFPSKTLFYIFFKASDEDVIKIGELILKDLKARHLINEGTRD